MFQVYCPYNPTLCGMNYSAKHLLDKIMTGQDNKCFKKKITHFEQAFLQKRPSC